MVWIEWERALEAQANGSFVFTASVFIGLRVLHGRIGGDLQLHYQRRNIA